MDESKPRIPSAAWPQDQIDDATILEPRLGQEIAETFNVELDLIDSAVLYLHGLRGKWRVVAYTDEPIKGSKDHTLTITLKAKEPDDERK